jgi:transcription elongation GreA/GreB family factor
MKNQNTFITSEGLKKLKEELLELKNVKSRKNSRS